MKKILGIALGAAVIALAGCGSSDDGVVATTPPTATPPTVAPPASEVPASAIATTVGLTDYANAQITATSSTSEPVVVGDATVLPVDNTTETSL